MEKKRVIALNRQGQKMEFGIAEYDDHVELGALLSQDVRIIDIPSQIVDKSVTVIGGDCFFNHREIEKVTIPDTVTRIGIQAFALCSGLKEIIIPDSVIEIGIDAFRDCSGLKRCVLPSNLEKLPDGLFSFCDLWGETEIVLPKNLKDVGQAFFRAGRFTLKIPDSVEEIKTGAFYGFDGEIETRIPYERGWFLPWPYGELVIDNTGNTRRIIDLEELRGLFCCIVTIENGTDKSKYFFPFDFETKLRFLSEENKSILMDRLKRVEPEEHRLYKDWYRGRV